MNIVLMDRVECETEKEVILQGGGKAKQKCDGAMFPVERNEFYSMGTGSGQLIKVQIWICSKCGREVK